MTGVGGIGFSQNAQGGNPRQGQFFRTVPGNGGAYHVYSGGRRVFVPGTPRNLGRGNLLTGTGPTGAQVGNGASFAPPDLSGSVGAMRRQQGAGRSRTASPAQQQTTQQQMVTQFMRMNGYG